MTGLLEYVVLNGCIPSQDHKTSLWIASVAAGEVIFISGSVLVVCFLILGLGASGFVQVKATDT